MYKKLFLLISLVFSLSAMAQKAVIDFDVKTYDFGKINEADGKVTFVFNFTNKGNAPMVINRVQASCGCTTPTYTKEPIEPGKKGNVTAVYNPEGRPGTFTKTITVYSNASEEQVTLMIKGEVIPRAVSEANPFPVSIGDIAAKQRVVQMNNINKGNAQVRVLEIKNTGKGNVKPVIENLPPYVVVKVMPEVLKPNEEGKVTFTVNSKNCPQWGPFNDQVYMVLNGQRKYTEDFVIRIAGNIVEDFSTLTIDQRRKAPIFETKSTTINLGEVKLGTKKVGKFAVTNRGINPLEIRRVINTNKEISVHPFKASILNGKTAFIMADVNTKTLPEGEYKKSFTVQTNDPDRSFMIFVVQWKVVK